ncbi:MAG TPA: general secretion pathway protein GspB [Ramlibacter sp.]
MRSREIVSIAALSASWAALAQVPAQHQPVPTAPMQQAPVQAAPQVPAQQFRFRPPSQQAPVVTAPAAAPVYNPPPPARVARAPAAPAPPMPPVAGLPADAPKLVINGGIYSERKDVRAAIVNGNVVHEGADLGSGVILQAIQPSGVVLAYHGSRYNIVY